MIVVFPFISAIDLVATRRTLPKSLGGWFKQIVALTGLAYPDEDLIAFPRRLRPERRPLRANAGGRSLQHQATQSHDRADYRILALVGPNHTPNLSILLTAATAYHLWTGLFSHRMIPEIRRQVLADPNFTALVHTSAVNEVEFEVFRIEPAKP